MYSKVIVPLDGSELSDQALPYAQLIARSLDVAIELVQAYDILPPVSWARGTTRASSVPWKRALARGLWSPWSPSGDGWKAKGIT